MKNWTINLLAMSLLPLLSADRALATNPLVMDQFTADPTARVFEGKIYVYPSHDILAGPGRGRTNWFCMEDYHVFSSENLTDWTDHGVIVSQTNVDWVNPAAYAMWAPDCVFKNGKYYFYFPAPGREGGRGSKIGVAIADKPYGPFQPETKPIQGIGGIDPGVLIDRDGTAYLYVAAGSRITVAKLKENMVELDSKPQVITNLPTTGLVEGPFPFERNGIYYLTYPHVQNKIERLEYAVSDNPLGPFKPAGVILDESASGCWTVHQSLVEYKGQWYLFYHDRDLSPGFDKARSIRADYLYFNEDGTIQKVKPTLRGVGVVNAKARIQIDRYSSVSGEGETVSFLDPAKKQEGWKISLSRKGAWVQFDRVDFGELKWKSIQVKSASPLGSSIEIHLDKPDGPQVATIKTGKSPEWSISKSKLSRVPTGTHNLIVVQTGNNPIELDWISFE